MTSEASFSIHLGADFSSTRPTPQGQRQRQYLTRQDRKVLIMKYLYAEKELRTAYNIRRNCRKGHSFRPDVFKETLEELYVRDFIAMRHIGPKRVAFELTEKGNQIGQDCYDPRFKPWIEFFSPGLL